MKNQKTGLIFVCGALLGIALTLCIGAATKAVPAKNTVTNTVAKETPKEIVSEAVPRGEKTPAPIQVVTYPSGTTGFFNPENSTLYLYDVNLRNCYMTRQLTKLGEPLIQP